MTKFEARGAKTALAIGTVLSTLGLWVGCGDSESTNPISSSSSTGVGGSTSTVPVGGGGAGGSGGTPTTSTTENGGSGGSGGGAPEKCVATSTYDDLFTIKDAAFCAIAVYEGDAPVLHKTPADGPVDFHTAGITFGSHGGPTIAGGSATEGGADVFRFTTHGATFDVDKKTIAATVPAGAFVAPEALDLGFFGWTAIGYAGAFPATQGELVLLKGTTVAKRYPVNSIFSFGAIVESADQGRLVYTGDSKLDDAQTAVNALYGADSCGTSVSNPALEGCGDPIAIDTWGDFPGPVAVDAIGNTFAIMASFDGSQEARGFAKKQIARGAAATLGATLFTLDGFGSALAAIAPTAAEDGILAFQPDDGTTAKALDVVAQRYHLASDAVTATDTPTTLLKITAEDTALALATDAEAKLWVAATRKSGDDTKLVFVVIDKKP